MIPVLKHLRLLICKWKGRFSVKDWTENKWLQFKNDVCLKFLVKYLQISKMVSVGLTYD